MTPKADRSAARSAAPVLGASVFLRSWFGRQAGEHRRSRPRASHYAGERNRFCKMSDLRRGTRDYVIDLLAHAVLPALPDSPRSFVVPVMGMSEAERRVAEAAAEVVIAMHRQAEWIEHDLIVRWRAAGLGWEDIGSVFHRTPQGARQRFLRLAKRLKVDAAE